MSRSIHYCDCGAEIFDTMETCPKCRREAHSSAPAGSAHRDFLAFLLYASDSGRIGEIPCRWGTLRDDLKEKWLNIADTKMNEWLASEEAARKSREDDHNPRAYFC